MKKPLRAFFRSRLLRRDRSTVPTGLLPLSRTGSAAVFVDGTGEEDTTEVCALIWDSFNRLGIPVCILCPRPGDLNWLGIQRKRVRAAQAPRQEDLFISLAASPECFAAQYEACCSKARFKVGRCALPGGEYDLVVAPPEGGEATQAKAFVAIMDYLEKIR